MWDKWIENQENNSIKNLVNSLGICVKTRKRDTLYKRYNFYAFLRKRYPLLTLSEIGKLCNQNHSTVVHALHNHRILMELRDPIYLRIRKEFMNKLNES